jgi:hypothetical protein
MKPASLLACSLPRQRRRNVFAALPSSRKMVDTVLCGVDFELKELAGEHVMLRQLNKIVRQQRTQHRVAVRSSIHGAQTRSETELAKAEQQRPAELVADDGPNRQSLGTKRTQQLNKTGPRDFAVPRRPNLQSTVNDDTRAPLATRPHEFGDMANG